MKKLICILIIIAAIGLPACSFGNFQDEKAVSFAEETKEQETVSAGDNDVSGETAYEEVTIDEGVYGDYAFINMNGEIKRYRFLSGDIGDVNLGCVKDDNLLFKWGHRDDWRFYEMIEYPERDRILGLGPNGGIFESAPYTGVDINEIEAVKNSNAVLLVNGSVESGRELWEDFYAKTGKHMPASIIIADCYTQSTNVSDELKKTEAGDYPCLYFKKLTYDGIEFVLEPVYKQADGYAVLKDDYYNENTKYYTYLRHFEGEAEFPGMIYSYYSIYILTDNNTADWDDIDGSQWINPTETIPYEKVYGEYTWKDNAPFLPLQ